MPTTYTLDQVFDMAQIAERNGARFYRKAASNMKVPALQKLLLDLASMEDAHFQVFEALRKQLSDAERDIAITDNVEGSYFWLRALAGGYAFDFRSDPSALLTGKETLSHILHKAILLERDAIVFYSAIRQRMSQGVEKLDVIIRQEMKHVTQLSEELAAIQ